MNKEVQEILDTLKPFHPGVKLDRYDAANIQKLISIETARLRAIVAEDQAKSSERLENHTRVLLDLGKTLLNETKLLRWLTVGLLVLTSGLLVFTVCLVIRH